MRAAILVALEDERYTWRTVWGISKQTGIDAESCWNTLNDMDNVIQSCQTDDKGNTLWTTKKRYEQFTPLWKRFLNGFSGVYA